MTSSEQKRADAMADAETLRVVAADVAGCPIDTFEARNHEAERVLRLRNPLDLGYTLYTRNAPAIAAQEARLEARAAFRAVPGLRGE
jgi:hypothetical protein